jgi:2-haloacid dehalogenase
MSGAPVGSPSAQPDSLRDVRAVVFDTFGTVVDWRSSLIEQFEAFGRERGIRADWTGLVDAWRSGYEASKDKVRTGTVPWTNLDDLHREALDDLVERFGIDGLDEADRDWLNRGWHRLKGWPDAVEGLIRFPVDQTGIAGLGHQWKFVPGLS